MKGSQSPTGSKSVYAVAENAGEAVSITLAAPTEAGYQHVIDWITVGFDTTGAVSGVVTITINSAVVWSTLVQPRTTPMNTHYYFPVGFECGVGQSAIIATGTFALIKPSLTVGYR